MLMRPSGPFGEMHSIDLRRTTPAELHGLSHVEEIGFINLSAADIPILAEIGFSGLRSLSLRHPGLENLELLRAFPKLKILDVWQSERVRSLSGLEKLSDLRWLSLNNLGPIPSLVPLADLAPTLRELLLTGGIWKEQKLAGDFGPLAALKRLQKLTLLNVRGPIDLSPICGFSKLEYLSLATAHFPIDEIAKVAAAYPFWRAQRSWLHRFHGRDQDPDRCAVCDSVRSILLLQRRKRTWCEQCDAIALNKVLADFDLRIENSKGTRN